MPAALSVTPGPWGWMQPWSARTALYPGHQEEPPPSLVTGTLGTPRAGRRVYPAPPWVLGASFLSVGWRTGPARRPT